MRVHHLNCGTIRPYGRALINGPREDHIGGSRLPWGPARMVCHCLLVEIGDGLTLIETGFGLNGAADPHGWLGGGFVRRLRPAADPEESATHQLKTLGFDPADVRNVILTHLDLDHAGGLHEFPAATVHVHQTELEAARNPRTPRERQRYRQNQWAHQPKWREYTTGGGDHWFGFDGVRRLRGLSPDILLVPLHGHTRGHCGVAVRTDEKWLLHAGDAYFHRSDIDPGRSRSPVGISAFQKIVETDGPARIANRERLRELRRDHSDQLDIISAHDYREFDAYARAESRPREHQPPGR